MSTDTQTAPPGRLQEIRGLHIAAGDGQMAHFRSVRCPARGQAVPLEQCLSCAESGGVIEDRSAGTEHVSCRDPRAREGRAAPVPPGADVRTVMDQTPVWAVMKTDIWAVQPDVGLEVLTDLLLARDIGGAPVVDAERRPVGVVSKTDLLRLQFISGDTGEAMGPGRQVSRGHYRVEIGSGYHAEAVLRRSVADAMTRAAFTVSENAPVAQAAALMALSGVHRAPVLSEDGKLAGMITSFDLVRWLAQQDGLPRPGGREPPAPSAGGGHPAASPREVPGGRR